MKTTTSDMSGGIPVGPESCTELTGLTDYVNRPLLNGSVLGGRVFEITFPQGRPNYVVFRRGNMVQVLGSKIDLLQYLDYERYLAIIRATKPQ